jgi:diguanylate cyclase (GGDEF)-like protein
MKRREQYLGVIATLVVAAIVLPVIWAFQGFLLFHILTENIIIIIHILLFLIGVQTYKYSKDTTILFIGTSYLYVAIFGILHALSYKGMGLIHGVESGMATQFWIVRRLLEASSLLVANFFRKKYISVIKLNIIFGVITLTTILLIFTKNFPICYIDGIGITPFKRISEYIIIGISIFSLYGLYTSKSTIDSFYIKTIMWALVFSILAEFIFTLYITVYDIYNGIGHLLYLFSCGLLATFIIKEGLDKPYTLLFHAVYEKSVRDGLTKLYNRSGLEEIAYTSFERAKRFPATFCLLYMDLDNFKMVNDEYGHPEGDKALIEFAEILLKAFREYDLVARIGGDEFVVLLEDGSDITLAAQKRLEAAVEAWKANNDKRQHLGVTFGMAVREPGSNATLSELIQEADRKLITEKARKHSYRFIKNKKSDVIPAAMV